MTSRCTTTVYWWDTAVTVGCVRPEGHNGLHRDGVRWFDDAGFQQPRDPDDWRPRLPQPANTPRGRNPRASLTDDDVREIRRRHAAGFKITEIAEDLAISYAVVYACARRHTYLDVA